MNKPDLMAELARCPFCGGTPTSTEDEDAHVFVVGCLDCGYDLYSGPVGVGWFKSLPDAIAAWNKRTHLAELEAVARDAESWRQLLSSVGAEQLVAASKKHGDATSVLRDAARYRWLRDRNNVIGEDGLTECPVEIFIEGESHAPGNLDAQVDQAMHNSAREG